MTSQSQIMKAMVITGPTASGKTVFAHQVFDQLKFSQIINADSKQVFRGLDIGSAKPSLRDVKKYSYKLIDVLEPNEDFSVEQFLSAVKTNLDSEKKTLIVGGTGFYLDVLNKGLPLSIFIPDSIKQKVADDLRHRGLAFLLDELQKKDPQYFLKVDKKNHRRITRSIEVIRTANKTFSEIRQSQTPLPIDSFFVVIMMPRQVMNERINKRVDAMVEKGLFLEVENILKKGIPATSLALSGIGYREIVDFYEQGGEQKKVVESIKQNSRRYAKQQLTWFKTFKRALFLFDEKHFKDGLDKKDEWFYNIPVVDTVQSPTRLLKKLKLGICHRLPLNQLNFFYRCIEEFYEY